MDVLTSLPEPTLVEMRMRTAFNMSGSSEVDELKRASATLINLCVAPKKRIADPEFQRLVALALTDAELSGMCAVKAATWQ